MLAVDEFCLDEFSSADLLLLLVPVDEQEGFGVRQSEDTVCPMNPGDRHVRVSDPFTLLLQFAFDFLLSGVDDLDIAVNEMCDNRHSEN